MRQNSRYSFQKVWFIDPVQDGMVTVEKGRVCPERFDDHVVDTIWYDATDGLLEITFESEGARSKIINSPDFVAEP